MELEIFGIEVVSFTFRALHAAGFFGWLLFDFLVYWLHFGIKDDTRALEDRLERAHIMHGIDRIVAYIFLLMLPTGIILCYLTDTPIFQTGWLNWKHVLYGLILIDALYLIPISGTALRNLNAIKAGAKNVAELNAGIKNAMNKAMPAVFLIWFLVALVGFISVINLKAPKDQEFIFRKTAVDSAVVQPLEDGRV